MPEFTLKYADARGEIHQQLAEAGSEKELRDRLNQQGFLIYSIKPRSDFSSLFSSRKKKLNMEKFLIFNQQFLTLVRAGLPILKCLDLLADRLTDARLGPHIKAVRDEVKRGTLLSDAFGHQGIFPPIYVTSVLAGEKSGSLIEVLERYISYTRLALGVRKKVLLSLLYPAILITLVSCLVVFMITYVVPSFAALYSSMQAQLPYMTVLLIAFGTAAREYILFAFAAAVGTGLFLRFWLKTDTGAQSFEMVKLKTPILGEIWIKYQVAQFARVLGTLLLGGIPLVQALETAGDSLGARILKTALDRVRKLVREGQPLSIALKSTGIFPPLSIDMIEVGESTGALPSMLSSVAEFYEEDVNTRMTAVLALIEPAIMLIMGVFVAFVLIALYLPIFSLADTMH